MSTTSASTESSFAPERMSPPTFFAFSESSRPWIDIQMLCQASITTAVPSMLFRDDHALRGGGVELAHELVFAGLERPHEDRRLRLAGDHLLDAKLRAVEL